MAMTKKHFVAFANAMAKIRPNADEFMHEEGFFGYDKCWDDVCEAIANICCKDNAAFDKGRFLEACNGPWKPSR